MPQLQFDVSDWIAEQVEQRAQAAGMSTPRYLAQLVQNELRSGDWPDGFFEEVVGGWQGEPLQRPPQGVFRARDVLLSSE